jgi:hypothetical protein
MVQKSDPFFDIEAKELSDIFISELQKIKHLSNTKRLIGFILYLSLEYTFTKKISIVNKIISLKPFVIRKLEYITHTHILKKLAKHTPELSSLIQPVCKQDRKLFFRTICSRWLSENEDIISGYIPEKKT